MMNSLCVIVIWCHCSVLAAVKCYWYGMLLLESVVMNVVICTTNLSTLEGEKIMFSSTSTTLQTNIAL